jgi:hypothetical protein
MHSIYNISPICIVWARLVRGEAFVGRTALNYNYSQNCKFCIAKIRQKSEPPRLLPFFIDLINLL